MDLQDIKFTDEEKTISEDIIIHHDTNPFTKFGKRFIRIFLYALALVSSFFVGGVLHRIGGGWFSLPDVTINDPRADILLHGVLEHLVIAALPTGLLFTILSRGSNFRDKFYIRRISLFIAITISIWFAYYIGNDMYIQIGRNYETAYCLDIGVFDWAIGHECMGFSYLRSWFHQILGMSLGGLIQTVPPGLWLFIFGFGWEFLLCGVFAGVIFDVAHRIPMGLAGFESGPPLAQFLWGGWLWLVLTICIISRRDNPSASPKLFRTSHLVFWIFMLSLNVLLIGSCITYSHVVQDDMMYRDQTLMGLGVVTGNILFCEAVYIVVLFYFTMKRHEPKPTNYVIIYEGSDTTQVINEVDQWVNYSKFQIIGKWLVPTVKSPWHIFLCLIRILLFLCVALTALLFICTLIRDRILRECEIDWMGKKTLCRI